MPPRACILAAAAAAAFASAARADELRLRLDRELRGAAPAAAGPARPAAPYVDRLIEGAVDLEPEIADVIDRTPGRRIFAAGYRMEAREPSSGRRGSEHGLDLQYRFETLNYGEFFVDAAARASHPRDSASFAAHRGGARVTIFQNYFPLTSRVIADCAVGVIRTPPHALFSQSYRIFLPTSLIAGASTIVSAGSSEARFFAGDVGRFEGAFSQGFDLTSGRIAGAAFSQRITPVLAAGAHWMNVRGSLEVRDHDALTAAVEYSPTPRQRFKAQLLGSDGGRKGGWLDVDWAWGAWRQRAGAYQLDRDVLWAETAILNDHRGVYWRADHTTLRETTSFGAEATRSNIDRDPSRAALDTVSAYGTTSLRIDRALSVGGALTLQDSRSRTPVTSGGAALSSTVYGSLLTSWGVTRLDVSRYLSRPDAGARDGTVALTLSQDWTLPWQFSGSASAVYAREHASGQFRRRSSLGLTVRGPSLGTLTWDASAVWAMLQGEAGAERDLNLNASIVWPIARNWNATAQLTRNAIDPGPPAVGVPPLPFQKDTRIQIGVRYEIGRGIPYASAGMTGGRGAGAISGVVFFDENGDGRMQPTERGAAGVVVYLDGRFPATTDPQGRFTFPAVPSGPHTLRVLSERLPLPWSVEDETPRVVDVPVRGEASAAIGLTRLRP